MKVEKLLQDWAPGRDHNGGDQSVLVGVAGRVETNSQIPFQNIQIPRASISDKHVGRIHRHQGLENLLAILRAAPVPGQFSAPSP
jgi:hypothetical protein